MNPTGRIENCRALGLTHRIEELPRPSPCWTDRTCWTSVFRAPIPAGLIVHLIHGILPLHCPARVSDPMHIQDLWWCAREWLSQWPTSAPITKEYPEIFKFVQNPHGRNIYSPQNCLKQLNSSREILVFLWLWAYILLLLSFLGYGGGYDDRGGRY